MQSRFFIAVCAGLVSGLLFRAANQSMAGLMFVILLTPLPIAIAGFGWGWLLSAIASVVAFGLLTATASIKAGAFHLLLFGLPITVSVYYLLLNRTYVDPTGREEVEWYPIGYVLFGLALFSGVVGMVALLSLGTSTADLKEHVTKVVDAMLKADFPWPGGKRPEADEIGQLVTYLTLSFSGAIALFWLWIGLFNLWIGAKVARVSGLLSRPWPNVSMITLPRWAGIPLALALVGSLLGDYPGLVASGFASGIFIAFLLVGLAVIHNITWNSPMRMALLVAAYAFLAFFNPISGLAFAALALVEPFFRMRNPDNGGIPPAPSNNNNP